MVAHHTRTLTDCVVPAVDGEQPTTCDGDGRWYAEVRERVGCDVSDRGVGRELKHHDDILLHLILKHQWALGKETLVRQTEKERGTGKEGGGREEGPGEWRRRERQMGQREGGEKVY